MITLQVKELLQSILSQSQQIISLFKKIGIDHSN